MKITHSLGQIERHYASPGLEEAVRSILTDMGAGRRPLTPQDTASFDEFHIRGRDATCELAAALDDLRPTTRVLDVGCGVGGASRHLAHEYACSVVGLDLTETYCRAARIVADHMNLSGRLSYVQGSALMLPFSDASFDVVWTQHTAMNIRDKSGFYREIRRVLSPGGALAMYDVLAGSGGEACYPLPWARDPSMSFLINADVLRQCLEEAGLEVVHWRDTSDLGGQWFRNMADKGRQGAGGVRPPGLQILLGPDIRVMSGNVMRNLAERRIALVEVIAR